MTSTIKLKRTGKKLNIDSFGGLEPNEPVVVRNDEQRGLYISNGDGTGIFLEPNLPVLDDLDPNTIDINWLTCPPQQTFQFNKNATNGPPNNTGGIVNYQILRNGYNNIVVLQANAYVLDPTRIGGSVQNAMWSQYTQNEMWTVFFHYHPDTQMFTKQFEWVRSVNTEIPGKIRVQYIHEQRRLLVNAAEIHGSDRDRCELAIGVAKRPSRAGSDSQNRPFGPRRTYPLMDKLCVRDCWSEPLKTAGDLRTIPYATVDSLYNNCLFFIRRNSYGWVLANSNFITFCNYIQSNPSIVADGGYKFFFQFGTGKRIPIRKFKYRFFAVNLNVLLLKDVRRQSTLTKYSISQVVPFTLNLHKSGGRNIKFY